MTDYQKSMIEKSADLRERAQQGISEMTIKYDDNGSIHARDVARVTELHNKAMMLSEAVGRAVG